MEAGDNDKQGSQSDRKKDSKVEDVVIEGDGTESSDLESNNDGNSKDEMVYTDFQEPDDESWGSEEEEEETGTDEEGDVDTDNESDVDDKDEVEDGLRKDGVPVCLTATQAELVWSNIVDNADITEFRDAPSVIFETEAVLEMERDEVKTSQKKELNEQSEGISKGGVKTDLSSSLNDLSIVCSSSKTIPSVPPCTLPPVCLYNQSGMLCTAMGERCILTEVNASPVFVGTRIEQCEWGPVGVGLVWCSGRSLSLDQVPEGDEVCFDAVILPGTSKFVALVVWQDTKPTISIEPYLNSYVIVDTFENIKVNFVSFEGDHGVVRATIENKEQLVWFSNSVVFKNGQKVESKEEIDDLCGSGCGELFANVCKLVTVDGDDKTSYQYGFMCSCLWSEMNPQKTGITSRFDKFTLYQKVGSYYSDGEEQLYMHCDAQSELVMSDNGCKLTYKNNKQEIIDILCEEERFYCGNQRVSPVKGGQVKAHLRRTKDIDGKERWSAVMIQLPYSLLQTITTLPPHDEDCKNKVFKNVKGVLQWNKDQKKFVITTEFGIPLPELLVVGEKAMLLQDNGVTRFTDKTAVASVQFDVYFDKKHPEILAIWKYHKSLQPLKPHVVYSKTKNKRCYYDVPGIYRGLTEKGNWNELKFDVILDGEIRSIPAVRRKAMFTSEGQPCNSIQISSQVTLHLKETIMQDGSSCWSAMLVIVETGQNDATNSESNAGTPVARDSSDTCSNLMKCNNKHLTKRSNENQRPKSNKTSKILKNCQGTLYWAKRLKRFKLATQTTGLPSELSVGSKSFCVKDGKVTEVNINSEDGKVKFDCYFDRNDQLHILSMWKGTKPAVALNKNGSYKYYYDVAGVYHGMSKNLMMFDVILNGQLRSITTDKASLIFSEEGQHCASISVSSQVVLHLKECCNNKERSLIAMVVVVERGPTELPSLLSLKVQEPKTNEGARQSTANSNVPSKTQAARQMKKPEQANSHIKSKNTLERKCATQKFNETVTRKQITRASIWQSDSVERGGNSLMEEIQTSEVFKNCHGALYWHRNKQQFIIAAKVNGIPFEVNIGKKALYVRNGRMIEVNDKVSNIPVQFDSHFSNSKLNILAIWQGNKPQSAYDMSECWRYYYDMPGVYRGQSNNNLLMFDVIADGQVRSITTAHTDAVYTAKGHRCKSVPLSSQVSLYLMEPCKVMTPWLLTHVIVGEQGLPSDSSLLALAKDSYLRAQIDMMPTHVQDATRRTQGGMYSAHANDSYPRAQDSMASTHVQDSIPRTQDGMPSTHVRDSYPRTQGGMPSAHVRDSYPRTQDGMPSTHVRDSIPRTQGGMPSTHVRDSYPRTQGGMPSTHVGDSYPRTQDSMVSTHVRDYIPRTQGGMPSTHVRDSYPRTQGSMASTHVQDSVPRTQGGMPSTHVRDSYPRTQGSIASTHVQDSVPRTQGGMPATHVQDSVPRTHVRNSYPSGQSGMATFVDNSFSRTQDNKTFEFDRDSYSIAQDSFSYTDRVPTSNIPDDDSMWLCPETLKQYLSSGSLEELSMKHSGSHPVYRGLVEDLPGGSTLFHCSLLPSPLIVSDIPQYRWKKSNTSGNAYCLLASKNFENGYQNYYPLFMWPEGGSCDPYIITANGPALHDEHNKLLGFEIGGEVVYYSYGYDVAFNRYDKKSINEFFHYLKTPMFAVVENITPEDVDGDLVEGEILFLSSSLIVALAGISTLIGNYSPVQIERPMPDSGVNEAGWSNQSVPVSRTKKLIGSGTFKSGRSDIFVSPSGTQYQSVPSYDTRNRTGEGACFDGGSGTRTLIGGGGSSGTKNLIGRSLLPGRPNQSVPSYGPSHTAGGGLARLDSSHGPLINSLTTKNVIGGGLIRQDRLNQNVQGRAGQFVQGRVNQAFQDRPNQYYYF